MPWRTYPSRGPQIPGATSVLRRRRWQGACEDRGLPPAARSSWPWCSTGRRPWPACSPPTKRGSWVTGHHPGLPSRRRGAQEESAARPQSASLRPTAIPLAFCCQKTRLVDVSRLEAHRPAGSVSTAVGCRRSRNSIRILELAASWQTVSGIANSQQQARAFFRGGTWGLEREMYFWAKG